MAVSVQQTANNKKFDGLLSHIECPVRSRMRDAVETVGAMAGWPPPSSSPSLIHSPSPNASTQHVQNTSQHSSFFFHRFMSVLDVQSTGNGLSLFVCGENMEKEVGRANTASGIHGEMKKQQKK